MSLCPSFGVLVVDTHVLIHAGVYTCTHSYVYECIHTCEHAYAHVHTYTFTHAYLHTNHNTFFTLPPRVHTGKLKYTEDIREGLEIYPSTVRMLTSGENKGKLILKV